MKRLIYLLMFVKMMSTFRPDRELSNIVIRSNEILVGKRRIVLKLAEHTQGNVISNVTLE
jgi:hypothetical protein